MREVKKDKSLYTKADCLALQAHTHMTDEEIDCFFYEDMTLKFFWAMHERFGQFTDLIFDRLYRLMSGWVDIDREVING